MRFDWRAACACARDLGGALVGQPNYEAYRAHLAATHPEAVALSREAFFRDREAARFGAGNRAGFRCC